MTLEKDYCDNCGSEMTDGKFCPKCGQCSMCGDA